MGKHAFMVVGIWAMLVSCVAAAEVLPAPVEKPALDWPHFPDRVHAFVWRNWGVAEPGRMGEVLGVSVEKVNATAVAMALPAEPEVPDQKRIYLTIIRRNWHLLPYEQLLTLLGWDERRLAETLREDDFLWAKMGGFKPKCERLVWSEPDEAVRAREAQIRKTVQEVFGQEMGRQGEKQFAFLEEFKGPVEAPAARKADGGVRFLYSYFAVFGDPLLNPELDPYPDGLLARYAELGVNGVWLHVVLRDLTASAEFPEFGKGSAQRLENLRKLAARAKRFGIGVYLYMNEPRAMPAAFLKGREAMAGVKEGEHVTMCTSDEKVRRWLGESLEHVFKEVPDLAGVFTITASENLTNCASHGGQKGCPRCKDRSAAEILAEINTVIERGVHRGKPEAKVIVWDWGWPDAEARQTIEHLPKSVWQMSVSEWSLPIERGGVKSAVGEYSLSSVGPGPRAKSHWRMAKDARLKTVAKVQVNCTWELSAVPWLPVMDLVAEHARGLSSAGVDGVMFSWSLGGYPSPNLEVFGKVMAGGEPERVLEEAARRRYGQGAPAARRAWTKFSAAFREYPFSGNVIYRCPAQFGPANLLYARPTGYVSTMIGFPYDDAKGWSGPYPPEVLAGQFEKVAAGWEEGLKELARVVETAGGEKQVIARRDYGLARAAGLHFRSVADQTRFAIERKAMARIEILKREASSARELYPLARMDSRIGFEASNQYYYVPQDLIEKYLSCQALIGALKE